MTKVRPALSFAQATTRVAGLIGYGEAARITGRSVRAVRYWTEDDRDGEPTISQALTLDAAWSAAGGEGAPILECYAVQLDVRLSDLRPCRAQLTSDIGLVAQEVGDAIHHALVVTAPGASPAAVHRAITETEQAQGHLATLVRRLGSFLKPAGVAGSGSLGGTRK